MDLVVVAAKPCKDRIHPQNGFEIPRNRNGPTRADKGRRIGPFVGQGMARLFKRGVVDLHLRRGRCAVAREFDRQLRESCEASPLAHGVIRFSTGVSEQRHPDTLSSWVQRSDEALYHAKASGRDQLIVDHDISMV